jgi:molybdopterin-containing oxidoreductase family iron-sulfur binding subunit
VLLLISVYNVNCKSKQALVHIYNIVTGSSVAVNLEEKFKSEVTKAAQQFSWFKRVLVSGIQDTQLLVLAINQVLASEAFYYFKTNKKRDQTKSCSVS